MSYRTYYVILMYPFLLCTFLCHWDGYLKKYHDPYSVLMVTTDPLAHGL